MGHAFSKDGAVTKVVEAIPGGGWITAPIHAAAGNGKHAGRAAIAGFITAGATVIGGPVAGATIGASGAALSTTLNRKRRSGDEKISAIQAAKAAKYSLAALFLLLAGSINLTENAGQPPQLGSPSILKLCDPDGKVKMAPRTTDWEQWCIKDWSGNVVFRNSLGLFLRAQEDGSVDLADRPALSERWIPVKNNDGSWSFQSAHGRWLSARGDLSSPTTVERSGTWEHFWLN